MTVVVTHSTPSDATFSATGATAWNADHTLVGLGTMAEQNANAVAITGGTINNTTIGATTPSTVNATTLSGQTGVLRGTGQNLFLQSGWVGGTSGTVGSGAVAPTSWSFVSTGGTVTYAPAASGSGNSIRFVGTSERPGLQQSVALANNVGAVYSFSYNIETVASGTIRIDNLTAIINATTTLTYYVNGVLVAGITSATSNSKVQVIVTVTATTGTPAIRLGLGVLSSATGDITISNPQLEFGSTANTYIPTTTTAVYGTPTLSFSGVSTIGLQSNGALFLQPAGTGAIQAQQATSTTAGGNVRGANAVDWQTSRNAAGQVASGLYSVIGGGQNNIAGTNVYSGVLGGFGNTASGVYGNILGGAGNTASGYHAGIVAGNSHTAGGFFNFIGGGSINTGTANAAVTTQATTTVTSGSTAVTLSGSNANIKVGQLIRGTGINDFTYVAAISGTSLTLSQNAASSGTPTLSFFTPHGVVVGGGNNQATGSYSFIGGGGDAGTAANRNLAAADWSVVVGGRNNQISANSASGTGFHFIGSGDGNAITTANAHAFIGSGTGNICSSSRTAIVGGNANTASGINSFIGSGTGNSVNGVLSAIMGGGYGTTRSISGNQAFPACNSPISSTAGVTQAALLVLAVQTTDATATALRSDTSAAGTTNQVILPNNSAYYFKGEIVSGVTGGGATKGFSIEGVIKRGANAASTALVGTPTVTSSYADAGAAAFAIAVTADTTNGGLRVTFTGVAATTIRTVCQIRTTEMTF